MASRPNTVSQPGPGDHPPLEITKENFKPCHMFFYGSLMDKDVLQIAARLPSPPELRPASISGWQVKMWGSYPTLVPASTTPATSPSPGPLSPSTANANADHHHDNNKIRGMAWELKTFEQFSNLRTYETSHYQPRAVVIRAEGGGEEEGEVPGEWEGLTFVWAGDPSSPDLEEGSFDLEVYQQTTKKYIFGLGGGEEASWN
ncbi:hypothetical protein F5X96DRAFT_663282 [Biscogniauxia mediterranea]|nr:hypothetical protein F5X96DRAFT_663282 [Biscogniauxia mediterranea]